MGILNFLLGGNKPANEKPVINPAPKPLNKQPPTSAPRSQPPTSRPGAPRPGQPRPTVNSGQPQTNASSQPPPQPPKQETSLVKSTSALPQLTVISKKDEIPPYSALLSATGAPLELIPDWQKNYAVLLISKDRKDVLILCSTEIYAQKKVDDDYLSIVDRCNRGGYNRARKILVKPEVLAIIYDNSGDVGQVDTQRAATKIQIEFDDLLRSAMDMSASDIHIEVRRDEAKVRLRVNGDLMDFAEWPVRYAKIMASVIYQVIADEKDTTFDEARPQDAIIDRELSEVTRVRVRLATIPAYPAGFDMVMRILKMGQDGKRQSLDKLGYEKRHLSFIRRAVAKPVGAVIMAGTTGSGKSTSLNSMLGEKIEAHKGKIKVITVEDPPEYVLIGATQVPVVRSRSKAKAGDAAANPFATVVRAAMRNDPDILMVGEVRDEDSAELLIHAVQSGHQVFTTVHASGGIDIIARLRSNGIQDDVLGGQNFIAALMYQALLPTVCPKCSNDFEHIKRVAETENEHEFVERVMRYIKPHLHSALRFRNDDGCPDCKLGVIGRSVASEVILPDPYMLQCFRDKRDTDAFMHYRRKGGRIALEHGVLKAFRGQVDLRDVEVKLDQITYLAELNAASRALLNIRSAKNFQIGEDVFDEVCIEDQIAKEDAIEESASPIETKAHNPSQEAPHESKPSASAAEGSSLLELSLPASDDVPASPEIPNDEKPAMRSKLLGGGRNTKKADVMSFEEAAAAKKSTDGVDDNNTDKGE